MQSITVKNLRKIFEDSTGLPKKECLLTSLDIIKKHGINISKLTKTERHYIIQFTGATIKHLRDMYRNHHCNFLSIRKTNNKFILHGFSENQDYIRNNLFRVEQRLKNNKITYKKVLQITQDAQLLLGFDEKKELE